MEKPLIPWLDKLTETDFVTEELPYTEGKYYHLFEERVFKTNDEVVGDMRYYVYDPTKHGYSKDGVYPVIYAFHGASASLYGITAINWAGVEYFASSEYQEKMGGAYIICPLANEYMDGDEMKLSWMTPVQDDGNDNNLQGRNSVYTKHLNDLFNEAVASFSNAGKTIIMGTSAGGYCAWRYVISYPVDAALIMAPAYCPTDKELELLDERKTIIWFCQGLYDELVPYDLSVSPILNKLNSMKNVSVFLPEFVRMPDYGVYSNPAGVEMGQHCINNAVQCDLMYNDGKPMDELHPQGVTGWIKSIR